MRPRQIATLLTRAYADWSSDGAARLGAALAYFTLFSVAPVLIVVTGVVGLFIGHAAAQGQIAPWLDRFLSGEGAEAAELMLKQAATPAGGIVTTVGGVITLFLGTSALVAELRQSMNIVWRVQQPPSEGNGVIASVRSLLSDRLYAFLLVIGAGLLVLTSLIVNTTVTVAATYFDGWLPIPAIVLQILNVVASFGLMTTMFTLVYKMVPDAQVSWGDASVGALITASLFIVGTMAVSAFVGTAGGSSMYGTAASVLALLVWVYYSAQVFFFGAEITRIFATEYGAGITPHHRSVGGLWHRK
jgi:membrane protein